MNNFCISDRLSLKLEHFQNLNSCLSGWSTQVLLYGVPCCCLIKHALAHPALEVQREEQTFFWLNLSIACKTAQFQLSQKSKK